MRNFISIVMATLLTGLVPAVMAQSDAADPLGELSSRFLQGYERLDPLQVFEQILDTLEPVDPQPSIFFASSQIRPLTMAVLALETGEGARDRVRYRISYAIEQFPNLASRVPYAVSFIQVDRFSLGSAIRQDAIDSYGAKQVAPPQAFDVGPNVSWRLVTRPVQGTMSDIVAAGRAELTDAQVRGMKCLNSPCLSPAMALDNAAPWGAEEEVPLDADPVPFQVVRSGLLTPAAAIDQLTSESTFDEVEQFREVPNLPEPFLEAVIEINLAQDAVLDAAMRWGGLMDDSVAALWRRLIIIPMGDNAQTPTAYRAEAYECARGPKFPSAGGLCP